MPKNTDTTDATIAATSATAGAVDRWYVLDTGTHVVRKSTKVGSQATAKCGAKGTVLDAVGTIPLNRRPPCEKCGQ